MPTTGPTLTVAVVASGAGRGRILLPDGVECRDTCAVAYAPGAAIDVWGLPDPGSLLTGWSGDCAARNFRQPLTLGADRNCTATFAPAPAGSKQAPADGSAVSSSSVLLQWDAVAGAGYYYVCLADTPITTACPTGFRGTTTPSLTWDGVAPGDHYWPFDCARSARSGPP